MKTLHQLTIFCFFAAFISCTKNPANTNPDNPTPPSAQVQLPDTITHFYLSENPFGQQSFAYFFPDTLQKNRIEFYSIDSSYSSGHGSAIGKVHAIYDYDAVTGHLIHVSSRGGSWDGSNLGTGTWNDNYDHSYIYPYGSQYPDSINVTNYLNRLGYNPMVSNIIQYKPTNPSPLHYALPPSYSPAEYYNIFPNDSGTFNLMAKLSNIYFPILKFEIPGYNAGSDDHLTYYIDSVNNYCKKRIYTNGFIYQPSTVEYFQPAGEERTYFQYDADSKLKLQALSKIMEPVDVVWFDIGLRYSTTSFQGRELDLWKLSCSGYVDSSFLSDANGVLQFYSANTYQNIISKDDKGRITSILQYKNGSSLFDKYIFAYKK